MARKRRKPLSWRLAVWYLLGLLILTSLGGVKYRDGSMAGSTILVSADNGLSSEGGSKNIEAQKAKENRIYPRSTAGGGDEPRKLETVEGKIEKAFGSKAKLFKRIAFCESSLDPKATNGQDWGLFQIRASVHKKDPLWLLNVDNNIAFAKYLYERDGLRPWRSSQRCWRAK